MEFSRLNKLWVGLILGIMLPIFCFSVYWLFFQRDIHFSEDDIRYLVNKELMINVFKMCCGSNLILFYLGINKRMVNFAKGIIGSVLIYALILAYLTFF